jgi:GTP pyrophosphokinase
MVPLNTPLQNGQTVEITTVKEGGPSRDWLNAELGYLASHRAPRQGARLVQRPGLHETVARGREAVEKLLQREGKTAIKLEDLATQLGFKSADALFEVVGKDEFSLRTSKPCCGRRSRCWRRRLSAAEEVRAMATQTPRAACWWWASIR